MSAAGVGETWDRATSAEAGRLARLFESAWRDSAPGSRPDPLEFLPDDCPGTRLALLRADLTLRREAGEPARVEDYLGSGPGLDPDTIVGLIYEEFCLREEDLESPNASEYVERFPDLAPRIRRVLGIHDLVGAGQSTALRQALAPPEAPMPAEGDTIAGFRLVRELGRGAFARVFLAEELALGGRSVALKVSRAASREPQALARLQHTHIVPIHSHQTDPESGLHLLCMPYFGRVTLDRLLADPKVREARGGAEVVSAIDRLDPAGSLISDRPAGRLAMSGRPYARAIAWWGARLAEALQHAHDRGVLHRDVKPSNVLITGDGLPMLLDFNLAWEPWVLGSGEPAGLLGGTLAYMAPEQVESLSTGEGSGIDGRADVYSLGVVLHEALDDRPFGKPGTPTSLEDALARALDQRRAAPRLKGDRVEIPPELAIVVGKCLAPDPADRYARPGDLAEDLQAVADDAPLRHAREPILGRAIRTIRRRRLPLAVALLVALVAIAGSAAFRNARQAAGRRRAEVESILAQGDKAAEARKMELAVALYGGAVTHAAGMPDLASEARRRFHLANQTKGRLDAADALHARVDDLRLRLLRFVRPGEIVADVRGALAPFYVLDDRASIPERRDWFELDGIDLLDSDRRERVFDDVDEILFLRALTLDVRPPGDRASAAEGRALCALGLRAASNPRVARSRAGANPVSWRALAARFEARSRGEAPPSSPPSPPEGAPASEFYRSGLILRQAGDPPRAIDRLREASRRDPGDYWFAFYLAFALEEAGLHDEALADYGIAIALRQSLPWAYLNRAHIHRARGAWALALADLRLAADRESAAGTSRRDVDAREFEEAYLLQNLLEDGRARALYEGLAGRAGEFRRAARTNLARLDAEEGKSDRALAAYDQLLDESPDDPTARLARALLETRLGKLSAADRDLNALIGGDPSGPASKLLGESLAARALVRLASGWPAGALEDAERGASIRPGPASDRLLLRARLAAGRVESIAPAGPEAFDLLPMAGAPLRADLRSAADRLRIPESAEVRPEGIGPLLVRSAILASLGDPDALTDVNRAVAIAPGSAAKLQRARVRARVGAREGAFEDLEDVLRIDPEDPRALALRGLLKLESGEPTGAIADLDRSISAGDSRAGRSARAAARAALGRHAEAVDDWTRALRSDPEDPAAYLGRARSLIALGRRDHAVADLESAAAWASGRGDLLGSIATAYESCLVDRPARRARAAEIRRRASG